MNTQAEFLPAYAQMLSIGLLWVFLHCTPMCGPIVGGLGLAQKAKGRWWQALLLYQSGRAIIYSLAGALVGFFGKESLSEYPELGFLVVALLLGMLIHKLGFFGKAALPTRWIQESTRFISRFSGSKQIFVLGMVLGFLPCMLTFWALSLAASTGSPFHGAFIMLLLIAMTMLPLGFTLAGAHFLLRLRKPMVEPFLLALSVLWTSLMTLAAMEVISHLHWNFQIGDSTYSIMFW